MTSIMINIKPKWVAKILNKEKTIEIRKTMPKCDLPIDVYIYCTKGKTGIVWDNDGKGIVNANLFPYSKGSPEHHRLINGKVVAKFTLYRVEEISCFSQEAYPYPYDTETISANELEKRSCLTNRELERYLGTIDCSIRNVGYAWYINNLEIFDEPKELSEFKPYSKYPTNRKLTKAPQSFMYVVATWQ